MLSKLQYTSSHAANYVTVKPVIADTGVIADAKWQNEQNVHSNSGICTSLVNVRRPKMV